MRLGIDFGTSSFSAAFMVEGYVQPVVDPNNSATPVFPSSIFLRPPHQFFVGKVADDEGRTNPRNYRHQLKRELGREIPPLGGLGLVDLVAEILKKVKDHADNIMISQGQRAFTGAVIGIPITYGDHQEKQMLQAAMLAGFIEEEIDLLPEPVAAALYYVHGGLLHRQQPVQNEERCLIYDLGGGTFDTAFIQKRGDTYQLLADPAGLEVCGGIDFDRAIYQNILEEYPRLEALVAVDPSAPEPEQTNALLARSTLGRIARSIKHKLSEFEDAKEEIQLAGLPQALEYCLTRQHFNGLIEGSLLKSVSCCQQMLADANFSWEQVDRILLVGGSCYIPYVKDYLSDETHRPVAQALHLESVVCHGLARFAAHHQVYTVSPLAGKADFTTLRAALKQAKGPGRIVLYPGVYREQQVVLEQENLMITGVGERDQVVIETQARVGVRMACNKATLNKLTLHHQPAPASSPSRSSEGYGRVPRGMTPGVPGPFAYRSSGSSGSTPAGGVVITQGHLELIECVLEAADQAIVIQGPGSQGELLKCQVRGGSEAGLVVHNGALADLSECVIQNSLGIGVLVNQKQSLLKMDRCHISENSEGGLSLWNGAKGKLNNCRIERNAKAGIQVQDASLATLTLCHICAGQGIGLAIERAGQVRAEECFFGNNAEQGILITDKGSQATLLHCHIHEGQKVGLEIVKESRGILEDCRLYRNAGPALRVNGKGSQVTANRGAVQNNAYTGVLLSEGGRGEFQALMFSDNAGPALRIVHSGSKAALEGCVIIQNGAGLVLEDRGEGTHTRCQIEKNWLDVYVEPECTLDAR